VLTSLDHDANISLWKMAAEDRGIEWKMARMKPEDGTLDYDHLETLLSSKTRLLAFTLASNVCGSRIDAKRVIKMAQNVGALTYVDAVHCAPHYLPDVQDLDCDFLVCSAYKFCGPHIGFVYGKYDLLKYLRPYKIESLTDEPPLRWESGTQNFAALNALISTVEYYAALGGGGTLRERLVSGYNEIMQYEQYLARYFLDKVSAFEGMHIKGIDDHNRLNERTPTFAIQIDGHMPSDISAHLAEHNIAAWAGIFHAPNVVEGFGVNRAEGLLRVSLMHYNTTGEIDRLFSALETL